MTYTRRTFIQTGAGALAGLWLPDLGRASAQETSSVAPEIQAWRLHEHAIPFDTAEPNDDFSDLQALKDIIGKARIVSLGEATHGTSEFFKMKHRLLKFLVEEMSFTAFAIEATMPEAFFVNDYVHTGKGDPARLLSGLYFWTWNTQEVLDMILWMRQYNQQTSGPGVSFFGFDMQTPREAMDHVEAYVATVQPDSLDYVRERYACFRPYQVGESDYKKISTSAQQACRLDLQTVYEFLQDHQADFEAQTSPEAFALALQHARLAVQAEDAFSSADWQVRDDYMAENVHWLLDTWLGPDDKIVLWAHNGHVANVPDYSPRSMGTTLRRSYGDDMVIMGFSFFSGSLNARLISDDGQQVQGLQAHIAPPPPADAYAFHFNLVELPRFFLNLRDLDHGDPQIRWLFGPRRFRSIGAAYNANYDPSFYYAAHLRREFDVIIYFSNTTASTLLPFTSAAVMRSPPPLYPPRNLTHRTEP
jgi:erythromycin esterase